VVVVCFYIWFLTIAVVIVFGDSRHQGMANQIIREEAVKKKKKKKVAFST
jgi:hypothetical protein